MINTLFILVSHCKYIIANNYIHVNGCLLHLENEYVYGNYLLKFVNFIST